VTRFAVLVLSASVVTADAPQGQAYDAPRAKKLATEIRRLIDEVTPGGGESGLGELLQDLVESLYGVTDYSVVDESVVDALAGAAGTGAIAMDALVRMGDRAVPSLVRAGRAYPNQRERSFQRKAAMDTLEQMLEQPRVARTLSQRSRQAIESLARDRLSDRRADAFELVGAGYPAVATRNAALRAEAARLTDSGELRRREVPERFDSFISKTIGEALATFRP
jgi:hypothetical protein